MRVSPPRRHTEARRPDRTVVDTGAPPGHCRRAEPQNDGDPERRQKLPIAPAQRNAECRCSGRDQPKDNRGTRRGCEGDEMVRQPPRRGTGARPAVPGAIWYQRGVRTGPVIVLVVGASAWGSRTCALQRVIGREAGGGRQWQVRKIPAQRSSPRHRQRHPAAVRAPTASRASSPSSPPHFIQVASDRSPYSGRGCTCPPVRA